MLEQLSLTVEVAGVGLLVWRFDPKHIPFDSDISNFNLLEFLFFDGTNFIFDFFTSEGRLVIRVIFS